jgi:hypothetical protein
MSLPEKTRLERIAKAKKIQIVATLATIDFAVLSLGAGLVVEDRRRWPVLLFVGPLLWTINYFGLRRLRQLL